MIRRSIAGMILGVSLLVASLAWSGFVALRTVLDPGQSQRIADKLYDDPQVRDALAGNIAGALVSLFPPGVDVPPDQVDAVATAVLDDPRVEFLVTQAFVQTHAAFLGDGDMPDQLDAGVVGQAARDQLVAAEPQLDAVLPAAPALAVPLPTERIPDLGPLRATLQAAVPILALLAVGGFVLALVTTSHRPSVLRRAGMWAIGAAALIVAAGLGLPWLIRRFAPDQGEVAAALFATLVESVLVPSLVLAGTGGAAIVAGMAWPSAGRARARPPRRAEPARRPSPAPHDRRPPRPAGAPGHRLAPGHEPGPARQRSHEQMPPPVRRPAPRPQGPPTAEQPVVRDPRPPRLRDPGPARTPPPGTPPPPSAPPPSAPPERRWVEGRGWVDEPPPAPRWLPGVGYVDVDDDEGADPR